MPIFGVFEKRNFFFFFPLFFAKSGTLTPSEHDFLTLIACFLKSKNRENELRDLYLTAVHRNGQHSEEPVFVNKNYITNRHINKNSLMQVWYIYTFTNGCECKTYFNYFCFIRFSQC